jgi:pimeloyl-ACP methyl ester carboxylesterase
MFAEFDGKPVAELEAFASRYGTRFIGPPIPSEGNPENKGKEPYFFKALIEVQGYEIHLSRRSTACLFREGRGGRSFVFVHGWTCDHSHFTPQMEAFCRNYRVIAVDLRGSSTKQLSIRSSGKGMGGPSTGPPLNSRPYEVSCESRAELSPHGAASLHPHALFRVRQSESNRN